jgi:hypothetical protein
MMVMVGLFLPLLANTTDVMVMPILRLSHGGFKSG